MRQTLQEYRRRIIDGKIQPLRQWDGRRSGVILDRTDPYVPLQLMGFGAWNLADGPFELQTGTDEYVLVPVSGSFEVTLGHDVLAKGHRRDPFYAAPQMDDACAIYVGAETQITATGNGEMVFFFAPAMQRQRPQFIVPGTRRAEPRGVGSFWRTVVTIIEPPVTSNLICGQTYSPPGCWSGTPPHTHDGTEQDDESNHEEIYFHLLRPSGTGRLRGYAVQLLFDSQGLDLAYPVHHRSVMAIPGGAHPVVVWPGSELIYIWALAGEGEPLEMRNIDGTEQLQRLQAALRELQDHYRKQTIDQQLLKELAAEHGLNDEDQQLLRATLRAYYPGTAEQD